jgi:hypothetical protein
VTSAPYLLLVLMNAKTGREDEFNIWYNTHIREAVQLDGWCSARRFRLVSSEPGGAPYRYAALYEIDDLETAQAALIAARTVRDEAGNAPTAFLHTTDAKEPDRQMTWWEAIGDGVVALQQEPRA